MSRDQENLKIHHGLALVASLQAEIKIPRWESDTETNGSMNNQNWMIISPKASEPENRRIWLVVVCLVCSSSSLLLSFFFTSLSLSVFADQTSLINSDLTILKCKPSLYIRGFWNLDPTNKKLPRVFWFDSPNFNRIRNWKKWKLREKKKRRINGYWWSRRWSRRWNFYLRCIGIGDTDVPHSFDRINDRDPSVTVARHLLQALASCNNTRHASR